MTMPKRWALAPIVLIALCGAHWLDLARREAALQGFLEDRSRGAARIADQYAPDIGACAGDIGNDIHSLAMAFVTVESFVTSQLESWARALLINVSGLANLVPDMTIGPARIRLSTARTAWSAADAGTSARPLSDLALARWLMRPCGAVHAAATILENIKRQSGAPDVDHRFVRIAAARYNGQSAATLSVEAKLSAEVYFRLVYDAFQHFRFGALGRNAVLQRTVGAGVRSREKSFAQSRDRAASALAAPSRH